MKAQFLGGFTHLENLEFGLKNAMHGKIMELEKKIIFMEKSWNLFQLSTFFSISEYILQNFFFSLVFLS